MNTQLSEFFSRISDTLMGVGNLSTAADWILKNTTLKGKAWSFRDHEFQVAIAAETAAEACVMKCSQIGLSELQIRITLAILAIKQGWTGIYVLPHSKFAQKFAKGRFDPVIEGSDRLQALVKPAANNSEMKRFGHSILYIGGASTETQAISIPADFMITDEYDFCDKQVLGTYASRLRHAENGGMRRVFSTPTLPGYGVSLQYDKSSKARYMTKCLHCGTWNAPDLLTDIVIPGFDREFKFFDANSLDDPKVRVDEAYLPCSSCKLSLESSFAVPANREWVHEFPTLALKGYAVKPYDVIRYNPTVKTLLQVAEYPTTQGYYNYVLGEPYLSSDTQVDTEVVRRMSLNKEEGHGEGFYMGVDVGKTVHVVLAKRINRVLRVFKMMRLTHTDGDLLTQLKKVVLDYGVHRCVIDAAPDYSLCQGLREQFGGLVNGAVYVENTSGKANYFQLKDPDSDESFEGVVNVARTKGFDLLVKEINNERVTYPNAQEMSLVLKHFVGMKRVEKKDENGEPKFRWEKVAADHYLHAMLYCKLANDIDGAPDSQEAEIELPAIFSGVTIPQLTGPSSERSEVAHALRSLGFGG